MRGVGGNLVFQLILIVFLVVLAAPFADAAVILELTERGLPQPASLAINAPEENPPLIQIHVGPSHPFVLIVFDGIDVTGMSRHDAEALTYAPERPLSAGEHRLKIVYEEEGRPRETVWVLVVSEAAGKKFSGDRGGELYSRSGLSLSMDGVIHESDGHTPPAVTGNLNVDVGARKDDSALHIVGNVVYLNPIPDSTASLSDFGGSAVYLNPDPAHPVSLPNFLMTLQHKKDSLLFGDVTLNSASLVAPLFSRRGLLGTLNHWDTQLQAFQLRSTAVTGFRPGVSFTEWDDQVYGGAISRSFFQDNPLTVTTIFVQGKSSAPSSFTTSAIGGPSEGRAAGLAASGTLLATAATAEVGWSELNPNTFVQGDPKGDFAGRLQLGKAIKGITVTGVYEYEGPDFGSLANPTLTTDRQQAGLSAAAGYGISSGSLSVSRVNDNVNKEDTRPVIVNTSAGGTYGLAPTGLPNLTLSYIRQMIRSTDEPAGNPGTDAAVDTVSGALSYAKTTWSGNLASTVSRLHNRLAPDSDSTTESHQMSLNLQPGKEISIAPALGWTETRTDPVRRRAGLAGLNLHWALIPSLLALDGQGSATRSRSDDDSEESRIYNGILRLRWNVHEHLKRWIDYGREDLSVTVRYNRFVDFIDPSNDQKDVTVLITLDLFAPLEGSLRFP